MAIVVLEEGLGVLGYVDIYDSSGYIERYPEIGMVLLNVSGEGIPLEKLVVITFMMSVLELKSVVF